MTSPRDAGDRHEATEPGPGILETTIVIGLAIVLALAIIVFFGGALAETIGLLVDAAHGGR